jgi:hypothetical protein
MLHNSIDSNFGQYKCNVTIACAAYQRRLSMAKAVEVERERERERERESERERERERVCTCTHMQKGYALRVIRLESTPLNLS